MQTKTKRIGAWVASGFLGLLAVAFTVNAGDIFFNHDGTVGQMRAFAAVAAIVGLAAYNIYSWLRETEPDGALPAAPSRDMLAPGGRRIPRSAAKRTREDRSARGA